MPSAATSAASLLRTMAISGRAHAGRNSWTTRTTSAGVSLSRSKAKRLLQRNGCARPATSGKAGFLQPIFDFVAPRATRHPQTALVNSGVASTAVPAYLECATSKACSASAPRHVRLSTSGLWLPAFLLSNSIRQASLRTAAKVPATADLILLDAACIEAPLSEVEATVRMLLLLPRRPVVVLVNFPRWCRINHADPAQLSTRATPPSAQQPRLR